MMVAFLLFGLFASITHSLHSVSTRPLFMWSPKSYFKGPKCTDWEVPELWEMNEVSKSMSFLGGADISTLPTSISGHFSSSAKESNPELIVAFIYQQLGSAAASRLAGAYSAADQGAPLSFIKDALSASKSCLTVPRLAASSSISKAVAQSVQTANPEGEKAAVVALPITGGSCKKVIEKIGAQSHLTDNGVTDLLLITANSVNDLTPKCMGQLLSAVKAHTTNYVALLSAEDTAVDISMNFDSVKRRMMEVPETFAFGEVPSLGAAGYQEIDIDNVAQYSVLVVAIPLSLFMIMMLFVGLNCMMSIETPVRFNNKNLVIAKEY